MTIPADARQRLTHPLRAELDKVRWAFPRVGTVPIRDHTWARYVARLAADVTEAERAVGAVDPGRPYNAIRRSLEAVARTRSAVLSRLMSMCPFEPFDAKNARHAVERMDAAVLAVLDEVEQDTFVGEARQAQFRIDQADHGAAIAGETDPLCRLFAMLNRPEDQFGEFSSSRVFEAYKYNAAKLHSVIGPHIASLGLPPVDDVLALVSICGWIADAPDPVLACSTMHEMLYALDLATASSADAKTATLAYLDTRDEALRQTWKRIVTALAGLPHATDTEARAHQLADVYKRIIEGPVRHYLWTMQCLQAGEWSRPPTLGPLQATIVSNGGWPAAIAQAVLLTEFRNGQAHESLVWDGHREVYSVDGVDVPPLRVLQAINGAISFVRGCEAAFAHDRPAARSPGVTFPTHNEQGRLQPWRRAEAFFGTNGLRLHRFTGNSRTAEARVEHLDSSSINPCFQALILVSRLLPEVQTFAVWQDQTETPVIEVSTTALQLNDPLWETALHTFTAMPLVTFLPANFNARSRHESESLAARSVAWIAVDDALDALDSVYGAVTPETLQMITARLFHTLACVRVCARMAGSTIRIDEVARQLHMLLDILTNRAGLRTWAEVDRFEATRRIRMMWATWGPVPRLPTIEELPRPDEVPTEHRPKLHAADFDLDQAMKWRSL